MKTFQNLVSKFLPDRVTNDRDLQNNISYAFKLLIRKGSHIISRDVCYEHMLECNFEQYFTSEQRFQWNINESVIWLLSLATENVRIQNKLFCQ